MTQDLFLYPALQFIAYMCFDFVSSLTIGSLCNHFRLNSLRLFHWMSSDASPRWGRFSSRRARWALLNN